VFETINAEGSTSVFQSYLASLKHSDLFDMPDLLGVNSDHDARYYTKTEIDASGIGGQFSYDRSGYYSERFSEDVTATTPVEALDEIFQFTSIDPSVSLSLNPSATREKGNSLSSVILTATTARGENPKSDIQSVTFKRSGVDIHSVPVPQPEGGTETYTESNSVSDTTTFSVTILDGEVRSGTASGSITFLYPIIYLVGAISLTTVQIYSGATKVLSSSRGRTLSFTTSSQVPYYCIPQSLGELTSIKDQNGYEVISSWTRRNESIVGLDLSSVPYYIYEFDNLTSTTQSYTFA